MQTCVISWEICTSIAIFVHLQSTKLHYICNQLILFAISNCQGLSSNPRKKWAFKRDEKDVFCALTLFMLMSRSFTKEISSYGGDNLILERKKRDGRKYVFHIKNDWSEKTETAFISQVDLWDVFLKHHHHLSIFFSIKLNSHSHPFRREIGSFG